VLGIAKLADSSKGAFRTGTNMLLGTPIYMSPEQCRGAKNVGDRSDVYALGVMLFEMLAGRPPFETEMPGEYIALHIFQPPPSLRQFVPNVDERLEQLLLSMLAKDPKIRPPMLEVAQRLKFLGNLQSDQLGRGPHERSSGPLPEMQPAKPPGPKPDDATEILPHNMGPPDWQVMNVVAGRQQTPTSVVEALKPQVTRPSGERKRENLRPSGFLTPQRRAQLVALLTISIAICIGILITLLLVGS
jgi:serine/threonine protein kinase